jgi:CO/xanthine dehydrogenase Mo-binding subunit
MSYLDKTALQVVGTRPIRPDGVDKVTGRANFGADMTMPGMLWGRIKRSPHAHARIVSINTEKARALPGVRAIITRADFPDITPERAHIGAAPHNLRDLSLNCMAKGKVLYEGHPVAAVAATSQLIAEQALDLIEVEYQVLPHVMDVEAAMAEDAPLLHDNIFTAGIEPKPEKPSNIAKVVRFAKGDVEAGFEAADVVIERRYTTKPVHQAISSRTPVWFRWSRRPDDHLQFEPGSVHGARLYLRIAALISRISGHPRPRSAAALVARRSSTSNRLPIRFEEIGATGQM